jgi:3',5'-cyclic AMP phosphodiesterase CpdA
MNRRTFITHVSTLAASGLVAAEPLMRSTLPVAYPVLKLAVLNDLHHDSPDCDPWFEKLVSVVDSLNPDLCVLTGDLANKGLETSLVSIRDQFGRLKCPVYPVPGNHDCDVPGDTSLYEKIFPGRRNYIIKESGWQLIFLDTTQGKEWKDTRISDGTLAWLDSAVRDLDPEAPSIVFSHFPLAPGIHMAPLNTGEVWKRLARLKVQAAFCGHYHGQHQVILPPLVTTNVCCAREGVRGNFNDDPRKGFWIVQADANSGTLDLQMQQVAVSPGKS